MSQELLHPSAKITRAPLIEPLSPVIETLDVLEGLLERFTGSPPRRPPNAAWERYLSLPVDAQKATLAGWRSQASFIKAAMDEGLDSFDESRMLRFALGRLFLLGDSSAADIVEADDVVEIYDSNFVQVYRSFSYFNLCNYSLLELSSYPWFELYERSSIISKQLIEISERILNERLPSTSLAEVPLYTVKELMTDDQCVFTIREKRAFRLISSISGEAYILSTKQIKEVDSVQGSKAGGNIRFI